MKKLFRALRRAVVWHRRPLAVVTAILGTVALVAALSPAQPDSQWTVVTSRTVVAGATLQQSDLRRVQLPGVGLPDGFVSDTSVLVGRMAIAALPQNAIVTLADVFTPGDLLPPPGKAIMPLRLPDDGLRSLLKVGVSIDLIGINSRTGDAEILARSVRVAAIPAAEGAQGFGGGSDAGILVLIEVSPDIAAKLTLASLSSRLSVILR